MKKVNYENFGPFGRVGVAWTCHPNDAPLTKRRAIWRTNRTLDSPLVKTVVTGPDWVGAVNLVQFGQDKCIVTGRTHLDATTSHYGCGEAEVELVNGILQRYSRGKSIRDSIAECNLSGIRELPEFNVINDRAWELTSKDKYGHQLFLLYGICGNSYYFGKAKDLSTCVAGRTPKGLVTDALRDRFSWTCSLGVKHCFLGESL